MDILFAGVAAVPLIVGFVEVLKRSFKMSKRWAPVASSLAGIALSLAFEAVKVSQTPESWLSAGVVGLALGLSASGLFSSVKTGVEAKLGAKL